MCASAPELLSPGSPINCNLIRRPTMPSKNFLDNIIIPSPCTADWNSMTGNDQVRFCEHCNLDVRNLSLMTRNQAERIVARSNGRLCVRYQHDSTARPL